MTSLEVLALVALTAMVLLSRKDVLKYLVKIISILVKATR